MGVHNRVLYFLLISFDSSFLLGREFATLMTLCLSVCLFNGQFVCSFVSSVFCSFGSFNKRFRANLV